MKIHLGNLDADVTEMEVRDFFRAYPSLSHVWIARKPPGFGFVVCFLAARARAVPAPAPPRPSPRPHARAPTGPSRSLMIDCGWAREVCPVAPVGSSARRRGETERANHDFRPLPPFSSPRAAAAQTFDNDEDGNNAIRDLNGKDLRGKKYDHR